MGSFLLWPQARSACISRHGRLQATLPILPVSRHFHVQVGGGGTGRSRTGCPSCACSSRASACLSVLAGRVHGSARASVCAGCLAPTLGVPEGPPPAAPATPTRGMDSAAPGTRVSLQKTSLPPDCGTGNVPRGDIIRRACSIQNMMGVGSGGGENRDWFDLSFLICSLWGKLYQFHVPVFENAQSRAFGTKAVGREGTVLTGCQAIRGCVS